MPKRLLEIKDFAGGLNAYADARDIEDNQFSQNWNVIVDRTGILRVVGCALEDIDASMVTNTDFEKGFGLFQFSSDYLFNDSFESGFDSGITQGAIKAIESGSEDEIFTLENTPSLSTTDDYYNGMTIFFPTADNIPGHSRPIDTYAYDEDNDNGVITVAPVFDANVAVGDEYIIYRWGSTNFSSSATATDDIDWITGGVATGHYTSDFAPVGTSTNQLYAVNKITSTDHTVVDGGYIEYNGGSSSKLTLRSGVDYTLSFSCSSAYSWHNFVSDGANDGSSAISERVPWIELHSPTVTNGIENTGLYLQSNGYWLRKSFQSNYIANMEANYIVDGDFENGGSDSDWPVSIGFITKTINTDGANDETYGGEGKSLEINSGSCNVGNPNGWIYQTLTLYTGVKYHLNFVYNRHIQYAVYEGDVAIIPWTNDATPIHSFEYENVTQYPWRYPNHKYNIETQSYESNYISFTVAENLVSATSAVQVRFASHGDNLGLLDCVSVTRAQNDLVTMSANSSANNPFATTFPKSDEVISSDNEALGNMEEWSTYSTTFKIPSNYNNATDWILRIHAGKWGWQDGAQRNIFSDVDDPTLATQEIYIDNIKLNSYGNVGKDVITLLQSNTAATSTNSKRSKVLINSSQIGNESWNSGFLDFDKGGAIPVFNYNNGILRISDSNFSNDNENIMMYYDKYNDGYDRIWRTRKGFLQEAPKIYARVSTDTVMNTQIEYDAINHINELCGGITFTTPVGDETGDSDATPVVDTQWHYDQFGENADIGIITRHMCDYNHSVNAHITYYNNVDSYIPSFDTRNEPENANKLHAASAGYCEVTNIEPGEEHSETYGDGWTCTYTGGYVGDWYSSALTPLVIPIRLNDDALTENPTAFKFVESTGIENITKVNEIKFNVTFHMRSVNNANYLHEDNFNTSQYGGGSAEDSKPFKDFKVPTFNVKVVIPKGSNNLLTADLIQGQINTNISDGQIEEDDIIVHEFVYGGDARSSNVTIQQVKDGEASYGQGISLESYIDNFEDMICDLKVTISDTISFDDYDTAPDLTDNGDSILIYVKEYFGDGHNDISGCLDSPFFDNENISVNNNIQEGTQAVRFFDNELSEDETSETWTKVERMSYWTKYFVNECKLRFYDDSTQVEDISEDYSIPTLTGDSLFIDMAFKVSNDVEASGWASRQFQIATSSVNIFDEESGLDISSITIGTFNIGECPDVFIYLTNDLLYNKFIKKTKIYMKSTDTDIWFLQFYIDHKDNGGTLYSTVSGAKSTWSYNEGYYRFVLSRQSVNEFNEIDSYEVETLVSEEDGEKHGNLTCRYKTSVVANNTLYVGNIKQAGKVYEDRMIKSPLNKYGILPASNQINVAINDGDEITALAFYKDKLLQFKKQKVFVINTSGDYEFLEDTLYNVGVHGQFSVVNTPYGVAWANENGFFLYDGEKLTNLTKNKIPTSTAYISGLANNRWCASETTPTGDCVVGYSTKRDIALINFTRATKSAAVTPTGAVYHFPTNSWTLLFMVWNNDSGSTVTGDMSNMITNSNGDISFYHHSAVAGDITDGVNTIRKWEHDSTTSVHSTKLIYFTTKDITFGDINVRKKLYRVYITYKVGTDGTDSNINVKGAVNGGASGTASFPVTFSQSSKFAFGESNSSGTACYTGLVLLETDGKWKTAELKFDTPSEVNNITSFQLQFGGTTPYDFEINDISISYRIKNVK